MLLISSIPSPTGKVLSATLKPKGTMKPIKIPPLKVCLLGPPLLPILYQLESSQGAEFRTQFYIN